MRDSDHSDADIRALGFDLLREEGYDEKFQGIECLAKTIKSFSADEKGLDRLGETHDQVLFRRRFAHTGAFPWFRPSHG